MAENHQEEVNGNSQGWIPADQEFGGLPQRV